MSFRIYFAHSKLDYNQPAETRAMADIRRLFPHASVICPNRDIGESPRGLRTYLAIVDWCDHVIVLEHRGTIGRGVFEEVRFALIKGKVVLVIRKGKFRLVERVRILNEHNWADGYAVLDLRPDRIVLRSQPPSEIAAPVEVKKGVANVQG